MDVRRTVRRLRRRWKVVGATAVLVVAVAFLYAASRGPRYTATATVRLTTPGSTGTDPIHDDAATFLDRLRTTYADVATGHPVLSQLPRRLHGERPEISVTLPPNTELMRIQATASTSARAAEAANADAQLMIQNVDQLDSQRVDVARATLRASLDDAAAKLASLQSQIRQLGASNASASQLQQLQGQEQAQVAAVAQQQRDFDATQTGLLERSKLLSVAIPASAPAGPNGPSRSLLLGLGAVLGLLVGVALALVFENLRTAVEDVEEAATAVGGPSLGAIPDSRAADRLEQEEAYRRLRANVVAAVGRTGHHSVLVTSAEGGAGRSTVVADLGCSLARSGYRVLVVDACLETRALHTLLGVPDGPGLVDVVEHGLGLDRAVVGTPVRNVSVLRAGTMPRHYEQVLAPLALAKVLAAAEAEFDMVLIDAPAIVDDPIVLALASQPLAVLVVARRGTTRRDHLAAIAEDLRRVGNLAGVAIVRARPDDLWVAAYLERRAAGEPRRAARWEAIE